MQLPLVNCKHCQNNYQTTLKSKSVANITKVIFAAIRQIREGLLFYLPFCDHCKNLTLYAKGLGQVGYIGYNAECFPEQYFVVVPSASFQRENCQKRENGNSAACISPTMT